MGTECECGCSNVIVRKEWETKGIEAYESPIIFCACHCHDIWRMVNRGNR